MNKSIFYKYSFKKILLNFKIENVQKIARTLTDYSLCQYVNTVLSFNYKFLNVLGETKSS